MLLVDGVVLTDDQAEFPEERETVGEKAPPSAGRRDDEEEEDEGIIEVSWRTQFGFN